MRPVFRIWPSKPNWARLPLAASYTGTKEEDNFVMRFRHKCECEPGDTIYFAFCFPHTYADNIARLACKMAAQGCKLAINDGSFKICCCCCCQPASPAASPSALPSSSQVTHLER